MGTGRSGAGRARAHVKKKQYKRGHATKNRARDIDQIQDDLCVEKVTGKQMGFEVDEDLPGLGQFYCTPCGRHFIDGKTRDVHLKTKVHKRRAKPCRALERALRCTSLLIQRRAARWTTCRLCVG
uniref:C2H2-type domain-containing protein n=1 Tax=Hyaloperonospora arabidopsidis (strain Emoy2) TaxID=559515 RepID=M4BY68_HYAAE